MAFGYLLASASLSLSEGSYGGMIDLFTKDHTGHIQIHQGDYLERPGIEKQIGNVDEVLAKVEAHPDVRSATPRILVPSLAYSGDKSALVNITGIDIVREPMTSMLGRKVTKGEFITGAPSADGYDQIMIGIGIARSLKLAVGDELVLIGQGADGSVANDIYQIAALVGTKDSFEKQRVFMSIDAARRYLYMGSTAHEISVVLDHYSNSEAVASDLSTTLSDTGLSIEPWQVVEETFYRTMTADKQGNYISVVLIMVMVSIGVLNTVLMSTLERTREFGLLKAIGTRPRQIFAMIITETLVLAFWGCLFGALLAWPINQYLSIDGISLPTPIDVGGIPFDRVLGEVSFASMMIPAILVFSTAFIVSLFPGTKAARVTPVRALGSA